MNTKTYEYFIQDLVKLLKDEIETRFEERNIKTALEDKLFNSGQIFSLYSVLSLIKSQAFAFEIPLEELQLEDYNLEGFLVTQD